MSGIYASFSQQLLTGAVTWGSASIAVMLVGAGYTPDYGSDATLTDIPSGSQLLGSPKALTSPVASAGFAKAANAAWTTLTTTSPLVGIAVLMNVSGTYDLVCYLDQGSGFGQVANAIPANIVWDTRGIFQP